MADKVRLVVLCEDMAQADFARHIINRHFRHLHRLRFETAPAGKGSGEQWVRKQYPIQLRALRAHGDERVGLLVIVDGDVDGVARRRGDLVRENPRLAGERVAIWVPMRNVESWFRCLQGDTAVEETTDYKGWPDTIDPKEAARRWDPGRECPLPSGQDARSEIARLAP